ncbi:hypothetical protein C8F01DRAFT_1256335 [Mycena amicta]|nr:hypothetical protein C8F01DRAFT_1256335 [Mycena amicta]
MHPSLDLANLTRLPTKLRLLAEIAVKDMISDLNPFMDELEATPRTASHLLCVAYALLDTSDADRLAQILPKDHDSHAQLRRVLDAMGILAFLIEQLFVETEAFHALWPRVWRWTGILTDSLDATNASVKLRSHLYSTVLRAFEAMRRQAGRRPECFRLLLDSEGYYTVLGTAWSYLLSRAGDRQGLMRVSGLLSIDRGEILTSNPSGHKRAFDGLVAGAGGSWDSLARLIVGHIRFVCPSESSPINEDSRSRLEMMGVIALLYESARSHYLSRLRHLLAKRGLVPALVIMSRAYLKAPLRFTDSATTNAARLTRHNLLDVLGRSLETPNPREAVVKALQAGILSAFFECSEDSADCWRSNKPNSWLWAPSSTTLPVDLAVPAYPKAAPKVWSAENQHRKSGLLKTSTESLALLKASTEPEPEP